MKKTDNPQMEFYPKIASLPAKRFILRKVIADVSVLVIILIFVACMFFIGKPYKRGFNCDDDSIRYPHQGNTIPSWLLFTYSLGIPLIVILINEFFVLRVQVPNSTENFWQEYYWQIYVQVLPFFFACVSSQLITNIAKYSIGRLRPHFIDICQPKYDGQTIDRFSKCETPYTYIIDFICSNPKATSEALIDSRLSFMSGHSSFSAVSLIYLAFYIQIRVLWRNMGLFKPLMQYFCICLTIYTGFTRISDYKHHWSDVMIGLIQGSIVASLSVYFVSDLYKSRNYFGLNQNYQVHNTPASQISRESGV